MCIRDRTAAMDAKLMIAPPPPCSSRAGTAAWHMKNAVLKLTDSSRSRISGVTSVKGPKLKNPPATFTTTSRRPCCAQAAANAARAASGCVRSPGDAFATMPSAANSFTRSARPTALTSASSSFAPPRPRARATACPIWPTRPTPVTSATLPPSSAGTGSHHCGDDVIRRRRAPLREAHSAVAADHVHRSLDAAIVLLEGVVRPGDRPIGIGQQREVEPHFLHIVAVGVHARGVHSEGFDARLLELSHLIAHGGELAVSAGGVVARIEHQRHVRRLEHVGQRVRPAVGRLCREAGRLAAHRQWVAHAVVLAVWPRRCSSCSSHSMGTRMPPRGACESRNSESPCQSEPPLTASPKRSAMRVRRCSTEGAWLGWRTSSPSSPYDSNWRICPSVPWSPRWAATATPPAACTRVVTSASVGSGFSTYAGRPRA